MKPIDSNASCAPRRTRFNPGIPIAAALLSFGLCGCFRVSSDLAVLRDSVIKSAPREWDEQIELGVGVMTLSLARAGLSFVALDPDARAALHAVHSAEVGVYKRHGVHSKLPLARALSDADKAMARRGWDRVVAVLNPGELVAIYVSADVRSAKNVKVCLVTLSGDDLVVASTRSNLEPLMAIAFDRAEGHHKNPWPIHL